jgi:hypothetical protein
VWNETTLRYCAADEAQAGTTALSGDELGDEHGGCGGIETPAPFKMPEIPRELASQVPHNEAAIEAWRQERLADEEARVARLATECGDIDGCAWVEKHVPNTCECAENALDSSSTNAAFKETDVCLYFEDSVVPYVRVKSTGADTGTFCREGSEVGDEGELLGDGIRRMLGRADPSTLEIPHLPRCVTADVDVRITLGMVEDEGVGGWEYEDMRSIFGNDIHCVFPSLTPTCLALHQPQAVFRKTPGATCKEHMDRDHKKTCLEMCYEVSCLQEPDEPCGSENNYETCGECCSGGEGGAPVPASECTRRRRLTQLEGEGGWEGAAEGPARRGVEERRRVREARRLASAAEGIQQAAGLEYQDREDGQHRQNCATTCLRHPECMAFYISPEGDCITSTECNHAKTHQGTFKKTTWYLHKHTDTRAATPPVRKKLVTRRRKKKLDDFGLARKRDEVQSRVQGRCEEVDPGQPIGIPDDVTSESRCGVCSERSLKTLGQCVVPGSCDDPRDAETRAECIANDGLWTPRETWTAGRWVEGRPVHEYAGN